MIMADSKIRPHPFSVHLANSNDGTDRFIWLINQRGGPRRFSASSFATVEEARGAVKAKVGNLIVEWTAAQNLRGLRSA